MEKLPPSLTLSYKLVFQVPRRGDIVTWMKIQVAGKELFLLQKPAIFSQGQGS
jgi:hypothetical protein